MLAVALLRIRRPIRSVTFVRSDMGLYNAGRYDG